MVVAPALLPATCAEFIDLAMRSPLLTLSGALAFNVNNREDMFLIKSDHSCPDNVLNA
jgi:hypothetical protein